MSTTTTTTTTSYDYQDSLSEDDSLDWDYVDRKSTAASKARSTTTKTKKSTKPSSVPGKRRNDKPDEDGPTKRPGRRPMEKTPLEDLPKDPKLKRKAQNRAAQRAFRERKERYVVELQERIRELEEEKSQKDTELVKENERLKEQLKTLQDENYALKGTPFTFAFATGDVTPSSTTQIDISLPPSDPHAVEDPSSSNSSTSGSGSEHSPETYLRDDESLTKLGTTDSLLSFGPIPSTDGYINNNIDYDTTSSYPLNDIFHSKDGMFADYRVPTEDFLIHGDPLPLLFGEDLFGLSAPAPFHADTDPILTESLKFDDDNRPRVEEKPCKDKVLKTLRDAKGQGRRAYDVQQELKTYCPNFNLDDLCDELKNKASCKDSDYVLTDKDVDCFIKCVERV